MSVGAVSITSSGKLRLGTSGQAWEAGFRVRQALGATAVDAIAGTVYNVLRMVNSGQLGTSLQKSIAQLLE
jgi:hypothetical protein